MRDKLLQIINRYGIDMQLKYIHSEYFELDEAILNYENSEWNYSDDLNIERKYPTHIAEEIADVMVMLKQFQYYYGIEDKMIESIMNFKIDRQIDRINADVQNNN